MGYLIFKIIQSNGICESCLNEILTNKYEALYDKNAQLALCKAKNPDKFHFIKPHLFEFFVKMELVCREVSKNFKSSETNVSKKCVAQINKTLDIPFNMYCDWHKDLGTQIVCKYVSLRLKISNQKKN